MNSIHIICGLPASGKTTYALNLATKLRAAFFDSDTISDLLIQAAHKAAGYDPHDRDSPIYKQTYREPVYETLFALAHDNLPHTNVILAGPFTSEVKNKAKWLSQLKDLFPENEIEIHHLEIPEELRLERMKHRGAKRDVAKLQS